MLGIGVLIIFLSIIGMTYGYWMQTETQNTFDVLGVKCFELTMSNETKGIHLEEASPITDEEGKKQEGYTFTIKNTCNTSATYQVNLEEKALQDIKRLSDQYIKVSLNDSTGKKLDTYEDTEATIKEEDFTSDKSHKLTSGSLGPEEEETYTLKLWMDYDTPPIEDVMNATFESKISVVATYIEDEERENQITITYKEQDEYSNEKETITFTVTSEKEDINIIEYSLDGVTYESLDKPNKSVIVPLEFTEEQEYTIYFKDALGNTQSQTFTPSKLDKTGPSIEVSETSGTNGAELTITFEDLKSGLEEYKIVEPGENEEEIEWIKLTEGQTETINYTSDTNKTITIYGKDKVGNINKIEYAITKADFEGPKLTIENSSNGAWSSESITIKLNATDDSGVSKIYYSTDKNSWNEISSITQDGKSASATFKIENEYDGKYYFKAEDKVGNESNIEETTVRVDLSTPNQEIKLDSSSVSGENGWYKSASITVTGSDTGGSEIASGSYCEGSSDCEPNTPIEGTSKSITLSDGKNKVICATFTDGAGNTSTKTCSTSYNVDGEAPNISSFTAQHTWGESNTLTANVQDSLSGIARYSFYFISDSSMTSTTEWITEKDYPTNLMTYTGTATSNTTWYFCVEDQAGNASSGSVQVNTVDTDIPILNVTNDLTDWGIKDNLNISVNDYSGVKKLIIYLNGETIHQTSFEPFQSVLNYKVPVVKNGNYEVQVEDFNKHITVENFEITYIDEYNPTLIENIIMEGNKVTIDFTKSTDMGLGIAKYESCWDNYNGQSDICLTNSEQTHVYNDVSNGYHILKLKVYDENDNVTEKEIQILVNPAAEINEKKYATISEALNIAQNNDTIKLLRNVDEAITIDTTKEITLNLQHFVLSSSETASTLTNKGNITIQNGALKSLSTSAIYNNSGTMNIIDCNIMGAANGIVVEGNSEVNINGNSEIISSATNGTTPTISVRENGILNINNGTIKASNGNSALHIYQSGHVKIKGGKIESENRGITSYGDVEINGGSIQGDDVSIYIGENSIGKITDGVITSTNIAIYNYGTTTISGGTVKSSASNAIYTRNGSITNIEGNAEITNTTTSYPAVYVESNGQLNINGGSISSLNAAISIENDSIANVKNGTITTTGQSVTINNYGTITISGGTITSSTSNTIYTRSGSITNIEGNAEITNITTNYPAVFVYGELNINGGSISSLSSAIYIQNDSTANIKNGTITTTGQSVTISNGGTITISGGTITSSTSNTIYIRSGGITNIEGNALINGATEKDCSTLYLTSNGKLNVKGGTITSTRSQGIWIDTGAEADLLGGSIEANNNNAIYNKGTLKLTGPVTVSNNSATYPTIYNIGTYVNAENSGAIITNKGGGQQIYG